MRLPGDRDQRGQWCGDEGQTDLARETLHDDERERQYEAGKGKGWSEARQRRGACLLREAGKRGRMSSNPEQQGDHDPGNGRSYAARERQRRDGGCAEVERDGNEVGDRNHVIALI